MMFAHLQIMSFFQEREGRAYCSLPKVLVRINSFLFARD